MKAKSHWVLSALLTMSLLAAGQLHPAGASEPGAQPLDGSVTYLPVIQRDAGTVTAGVFIPLKYRSTWDDDVAAFIAATGKTHGVHLISSGFGCAWVDTVADIQIYLDYVHSLGAMPLITWMPMDCSNGGSGNVATLSLQDILNGQWDAYMTAWANGIAALGYPVFVRWGHEMNIPSYAWAGQYAFGADGETYFANVPGDACGGLPLTGCYGDPAQYDGPERYIAAYRKVHALVAPLAPNIRWIWNPNARDWPQDTAWNGYNNYYPGDDVVDWVGPDGYNWGEQSTNGGYGGYVWATFDLIFQPVLNDMASRHPTKPQIIPEFGSAEDPYDPGRKAAWISDAYRTARANYPLLRVVCWVEERFPDVSHVSGADADFRATSSTPTLQAYRQAVAAWSSSQP